MSRPVVLSEGMISRAMADPKFLATVPEFSGLRQAVKTIEIQSRGCRSCQKAKAYNSLLRDFIHILMPLGPEPKARLKRYLGTESLMLNTHDPRTNSVEVKII